MISSHSQILCNLETFNSTSLPHFRTSSHWVGYWVFPPIKFQVVSEHRLRGHTIHHFESQDENGTSPFIDQSFGSSSCVPTDVRCHLIPRTHSRRKDQVRRVNVLLYSHAAYYALHAPGPNPPWTASTRGKRVVEPSTSLSVTGCASSQCPYMVSPKSHISEVSKHDCIEPSHA